jgi:hypothetical protein
MEYMRVQKLFAIIIVISSSIPPYLVVIAVYAARN